MKNFTKKHVDAVSARLREYERVLEKGHPFETLPPCNICDTCAPPNGKPCCANCLFSDPDGDNTFFGGPDWCMRWPHQIGSNCTTKAEQRKQFKHLLNLLKSNGYEFK